MTLQQIAKYSNITSGVFVILGIVFVTFVNFYPNVTGSYFDIKNIVITGVHNSDQSQIESLFEGKEKNLLELKLIKLSSEIESLNWIKKTNIKKIYPDTVLVSVTENQPFAYFLNGQQVFLIDSDGERIIEKKNLEKFDKYLILSGINSDLNIATLIKNINIFYSDILSSIKEIEFIENRRWDIILKNDLKIKLSENYIKESILNLKKLINDEQILKSNIIEVDLRIIDRAIIKVDGDELKLKLEEV